MPVTMTGFGSNNLFFDVLVTLVSRKKSLSAANISHVEVCTTKPSRKL